MKRLLVSATLLATACAPVAPVVPTAKPNGIYVPTARVRLEPAALIDAGAAALPPGEEFGGHLYTLAAGPATRLRPPANGNGLFLAVGTPEPAGPNQDVDLSLDGAQANEPTGEEAPELPTGPGCAMPSIALAGDIGGYRVFDVAGGPAPAPAAETDRFWVIRAGLPAPKGQAFDEVEVPARRVVAGKFCQVYLDASVTEPAKLEAARAIADAFDTKIYPTDTRVFGSAPVPGIDGEPKIYIVISPEVSGRGQSAALAYFARRDLSLRAATPPSHAHSNQKEVLFIDAFVLEPERRNDLLAAVAHEFQHLINFHHKAKLNGQPGGETLWLDESLAMYASHVCGYGIDTSRTMYQHVAGYLSRPYKYSLTDWPGNPAVQGYGVGFLFLTYLADRFGQDLVTAAVASPQTGKANLDALLGARGSSFAAAFDDFGAALANDGLFPDPSGRFAFKSLHVRGPNPFGELNGPSAIRVGPSGAHLPRRADVAFLFHWKPPAGADALVLRGRGGPFGAVALVP
jgi:hypothetical protein